MLNRELDNFTCISDEAREFADAAIRANWFFEDYICCAKEAWLVAHEGKLTHAIWEIENYEKQQSKTHGGGQ